MNSICFFTHEISDQNIIHFSDHKRVNHLNTHLRAKIDDQLVVTILDRGIFKATLIEIDKAKASIELEDQLPSETPWFNLIIGLSRPPTIKKILEHTSTFGVESITIVKAKLSEKSYATSKIYNEENLTELLHDGISQSRKYFKIPSVNVLTYMNFEKFKGIENKYFLSLNTKDSFLSCSMALENPTIAIGPERGWTKLEEEKLIENGFKPIGISNSTLRVEHATFAAISQIEMIKLNMKDKKNGE